MGERTGEPWTEEEVKFLKENYQDTSYIEIGEELGRSKWAVRHKARELGLTKQESWTEDEIRFLKNNYRNTTYKKIRKKLDRSKQAIQAKASELRLGKQESWTEEEVKSLKENYQDMTYEKIGEKLGRSKTAVQRKVQRLGLAKEKPWTEEETRFLKKNYQDMTYKEIGEKLGRDEVAVRGKMRNLGLKKEEHKFWTKEEIINKLQTLAETHGEKYLCTKNLGKNEPAIYCATRNNFGSLAKAIEEAGFDYKKIRMKKPKGYWTKERIVKRIRKLAEDYGKKFLTSLNIQEKEAGLKNAAEREFGSLKEAVEKAGFNYHEITQLKKDYWTEKKVIERLRDLAEKYGKEYLSSNNLTENEGDLLNAVQRIFSSLKAAVEEAEFSYYEMSNQYRYWTRDLVANKLQELARKQGLEYLSPSNLQANEARIYHACRKVFGSLKVAIEEAGFDYRKILKTKPKGYWTKEKIVEKLRKLANKKGLECLNPSNLRENETSLLKGARRVFGSFKDAVEKAGFDYESIITAHPGGWWTEDRIIDKLQELAEKYGEKYLNRSNMCAEGKGGLVNSAAKTFGSYRKAVEKIGFDYDEIKRPDFGERVQWYAWEECCKEIAELIFDSNKVLFKNALGETSFRPDLQIPEKNTIVDAKLSARRKSIKEDIDHYENHCDRLEFWCLRGEREIPDERVDIITSKELLERLRNDGAEIEEFKEKFHLIERGVNPYEKAQEKITAYA